MPTIARHGLLRIRSEVRRRPIGLFTAFTRFIGFTDFSDLRNVAEPRSLSIVRYENDPSPLPPGQRAIADFPRFGVVAFAKRPLRSMEIRLEISGSVGHPITLRAAELATLPRTSVAADFHCAAGWSHRSVEWSGLRFRDVWDTFIAPHAQLRIEHGLAVLRCQDRYRTALPLADLLRPEVLVADQLNGQPLTVEHGAPIRLVAPAHYGYKSAKHLVGIELRPDDQGYRPLLPRLLDHPRARVALEERGQLLPGWLLRYLFRPLIRPLIRRMQRATEQQRTRP